MVLIKWDLGYINNVEITVCSDFGTMGYGCTPPTDGWVVKTILVFDADCGLGYELPTPTPTPEEETPTPLQQSHLGHMMELFLKQRLLQSLL